MEKQYNSDYNTIMILQEYYAANRARTCDILVNSQTLYQLSYGGTLYLCQFMYLRGCADFLKVLIGLKAFVRKHNDFTQVLQNIPLINQAQSHISQLSV